MAAISSIDIRRSLTPRRGGRRHGYVNAWQFDGGLYLQGPASCNHGPVDIARQPARGPAQIIKAPAAADAQIVTATATSLLILRNGRTSMPSLAWYNPATRAITVTVPATPGTTGVLTAVPCYAREALIAAPGRPT